MKRVERRLANIKKPHIVRRLGQWVVVCSVSADSALVRKAVLFVDRLNEPDRRRRELNAAVEAWRALP